MARRRSWLALVACTAALLLGGNARAQSTADELARKHFESGAAYLEQSDYEPALREFQAAYDLSKRPEVLLSVATVNERLGKLRQALDALDRFIEEAPNDPHAESVEIRILNLKKRLAEQEADSAAAAPPASAPSTGPGNSAEAPAEPPRKTTKVPAYIFLASSGAFAVGSLVTGLLASAKHSKLADSCSPNCTDSELSSGRSLAVTSTVLTGAAVVTGAVGAFLFFKSGNDAPRASSRPSVSVGVSPFGVTAATRWRF